MDQISTFIKNKYTVPPLVIFVSNKQSRHCWWLPNFPGQDDIGKLNDNLDQVGKGAIK